MECPSCKQEIADNAVRCPHCGRSTVRSEMTPSAMRALAWFAVGLLMFLIIAALMNRGV